MNKFNTNIYSISIAVVLFALLPNSVFWLVSFKLDLNRSIINIDYILAGTLLVFGFRKLALLALTFCLLVDAIVVAGLVYPFVRVQDITYLLSFVPHAPLALQLSMVIMTTILIVILFLIGLYGKKVGKLSALILLNISLLIYGIKVHSATPDNPKYYRANGNVFDSQLIFFTDTRLVGFIDSFQQEQQPLEKVGFLGATSNWANTDITVLNDKLLLIVAESWGSPKDSRINEKILSPLYAVADHLEWVEIDQTRSAMATVLAELRELCGLGANNFNLKKITEGFDGCLPAKLKEHGYHTSAIHGSIGIMYDRIHWYPRAGFDEIVFSESLPWKTRCYSYPGVCDREILSDYIANAFAKKEKKFLYYLTLNTHAIYDERDIHVDIFDCEEFDLNINSETCRMNKLHAQFFYQLAEILSTQEMQGVEVLIVGDHEPRILNKEEFEKNYIHSAVSMVHLKTKLRER